MAESFSTENRFFDNKHYPRGFSRHGDFTIKKLSFLNATVLPLMSWIYQSVSLQPKKNVCLLKCVVACVSRKRKLNVYGLSI